MALCDLGQSGMICPLWMKCQWFAARMGKSHTAGEEGGGAIASPGAVIYVAVKHDV